MNTQEAHARWWVNEGSAMRPLPDEDVEEFAHRITQIAWSNGAHVEREECVKVCESVKAQCEADAGGYIAQEDAYAISAAAECATVIRARSTT